MSDSISAVGAADSIGDGAAVHRYYDRERQWPQQNPWQQKLAEELHAKAEERRAHLAQQVVPSEQAPAHHDAHPDGQSGIDTRL
jgi:hypothetical protein